MTSYGLRSKQARSPPYQQGSAAILIILAPISETTAEDRLGLGPESLAQDLDWDWIPRLKAGTGRDWALECRSEGRDWHWESSVTGETLVPGPALSVAWPLSTRSQAAQDSGTVRP